MKIGNAYSGYCLKCNKLVEKNKGYLKLKNPQPYEIRNKKRQKNNPRKWGVLCNNCYK